MSEEAAKKKTGATPLPEGDILASGEVLGVLDVQVKLVKYRDGYGKEVVTFAHIIPGGEVYLEDPKTRELKQAQRWLKAQILERIKE